MVVEVTNPLNNPMHYGEKPPVGIISAPDELPHRILYTDAEANKIYHELQHDIYQDEKHTKNPRKKGFPAILKIVGGIVLLGAAIVFRKNIAQFFKNIGAIIKSIFKKKP